MPFYPYLRSTSPTRGRTTGDPSSDSSPAKSKIRPFDDVLPTLPDLFGCLGFQSPQRPSSPIRPDIFTSIPGLPHLFAGTRLSPQSPQRPSSPTHPHTSAGTPLDTVPEDPSTPVPMQPSNTPNVTPAQTRSSSKPNTRSRKAKAKAEPKHPPRKLGRRPSLSSTPEPDTRARRKRLQERERTKARTERRKIPGSFPGGDSSIASIDQQENMSSDKEMEHESSPDKNDKVIPEEPESLRSDRELKQELENSRQRVARLKEELKMRRQASPERKRRLETECQLHGERLGREGSRLFGEDSLRANHDRLNILSQKGRSQRKTLERLRQERRTREIEEYQWGERRECFENGLKSQERDYSYREEQERLAREQEERFPRELRDRLATLKELQERKAREEQERLAREQERLAKEQQERKAREEQERLTREQQERERQARQTEEEQLRQYFILYEAKWNEIRSSNSTPPIHLHEFPWPVFGVVSSVAQITSQQVRGFLFHPLRPEMQGKSARDMIKSEMLRFHPDKFETRVKPKIQDEQKAVAKEIAEAVAKVLTNIMTEEAK